LYFFRSKLILIKKSLLIGGICFLILAIYFLIILYDRKNNLNNILFLDIETAEVEDYNELDSEMKDLWEHKTQYQRKEEHTAEDFYSRAGIC
jgi:hypothetical protein